jgi:oligogalacturonide transport system permease protein
MLYPLLWLVGASFKTNSEIFSSIGLFPSKIDFQPYIDGWKTSTEYTFTRYFLNTFAYVIPKVILTVVSSVLTAYAFVRFKFPGQKILFGLLIGTMFLPQIILKIPQYLLWKQFGLLDTYVPLFLPQGFAVEGFFVFMMVQFFRTIPKAIDEAATIDGCNTWQLLILILVPILLPAILSVALFQFMWTMNDFMSPLIYISSVSKYPVSIALQMAKDTTEAGFEWNKIIAMSILALLPSIVVFFAAQKYFIQGITTSGIKG